MRKRKKAIFNGAIKIVCKESKPIGVNMQLSAANNYADDTNLIISQQQLVYQPCYEKSKKKMVHGIK